MVLAPGVNVIKLFWAKFTHSFFKAISFLTHKNIGYIKAMI
jgi:hypothetical protein